MTNASTLNIPRLAITAFICMLLCGCGAQHNVASEKDSNKSRGFSMGAPSTRPKHVSYNAQKKEVMWHRNTVPGKYRVVSVDDINYVKSLNDVATLVFDGCDIPPETLRSICTAHDIDTLALSDCVVNDDHIASIVLAKSLRWLSITQSQITDRGVANLCQLRKLDELVLNPSPLVTKEGVSSLKACLPQCNIQWSE